MIILLDTSSPVCKLTIVSGDSQNDYEWQSDRGLAKGLLGYIHEKLQLEGGDWSDIEAIGVYEGPGSFTGLRIGLTVANTIADAQSIPIVGASSDDWKNEALSKIHDGQNEKIVLPLYGSEANVTKPRK
jgi:tRNA threonylcarbamoyladenosine biosynthesis protein TsaB